MLRHRALLGTQPAHPDTDVDQRVIEEEAAFESAETSVPPEEAVAERGQARGQVVLGEVHVVVRRNEGGARRVAGPVVVEPLRRHEACTVAGTGGRVQGYEPLFDRVHGVNPPAQGVFPVPVGTASSSSSARWRSGTKPGVSTQNSKEMPLGSVT